MPSRRSALRPSPLLRALRAGAAIGACFGLSGCLNSLTSYTDPPQMSPVAQSRQAIDPSLPSAGFDMDRYAFRLGANARASAYGAGDRPGAYPEPSAQRETRSGGGSPSLYQQGLPPLYRIQTGSIYSDRRARAIGDPVTVIIEISESASLTASSTRSRGNATAIGAPTVFGLEQIVDRIIPGDTVGLAAGAQAETDTSSTGQGSVSRDETVDVRIAATVVDVLPNGNLVIVGSQEIRVNFELRDVQVVGVVRPSDIARDNTVTHDRIASARVSIGGDGPAFNATGQTYGEVIVEGLRPF